MKLTAESNLKDRCSYCHRKLRTQKSMQRGVGSTCWEKLGGGTTLRDRAHRKRNKIKAKLMEHQVDDEGQMEFQFNA